MSTTTLRFTALDTLFFRESRSFETIGGSELASLFPPPPRTVAGAIRSVIGDAIGADWHAFHKNLDGYTVGDIKLRDLIGYGDDLGQLCMEGLWISEKGERLYPAPFYLLRKDAVFQRLHIGDSEQTSLGRVRLPQLPSGCEGFKPLENAWLTSTGLENVLADVLPGQGELREKKHLYTEESRLGIARDNSRRTVTTGLLYQSRHIRPMRKVDLAIETDITGLGDTSLHRRIVRLGGEGRIAGIEVVPSPPFPKAPTPNGTTKGLILTFLSPARFSGQAWLPSDFKPMEINGLRMRIWKGMIDSIALTIHCAVIGKALREGGWDMAKKMPRPVQSLIPAGSAWYCTVDDGGDLTTAIKALHGRQIGEDQKFGRGRIACGLWNDKQMTTNTKGEEQ